MSEKRGLLTEAEADERDARFRAAGIRVADSEPGEATIHLLTKRPTADSTEDEREA